MELIVGDSLQGFGAGIPAQDVNEAYGIDLRWGGKVVIRPASNKCCFVDATFPGESR
jgi:hypothetical protein